MKVQVAGTSAQKQHRVAYRLAFGNNSTLVHDDYFYDRLSGSREQGIGEIKEVVHIDKGCGLNVSAYCLNLRCQALHRLCRFTSSTSPLSISMVLTADHD